MKKNNLLIIVAVTVVAVGVIIAVIIASIANSAEGESSENSPQIDISSSMPYDNSEDVPPPDDTSVPVTSDTESSSSTPSDGAKGIVATANSLIGVPFVDNGADTDGFDNSGFIYYVLRENGYITCPRTTREQTKMGAKLNYSQLKAGDLAFFSDNGEEDAVFGGIYIGNGKMIGCLMPGQSVKVIDITTEYYKSSFYRGISLS